MLENIIESGCSPSFFFGSAGNDPQKLVNFSRQPRSCQSSDYRILPVIIAIPTCLTGIFHFEWNDLPLLIYCISVLLVKYDTR